MASSDYGFNSVEDLLAYLKRYGVRVGEEVMEGMSQIKPGPMFSNLPGAAQILSAPLTPGLTDLSEQAAEYVTPLLNRRAAWERENLFDFGELLEEGGFDVPEQEDLTKEQVAPWLLAAASLGRKPPKVFRNTDKDVDYPISKEGFFSPTQKTIAEQAGNQPVTWAGQTPNQWLKAFQRGGANQEIKETGLLAAMQEIVPNENTAISPEQMWALAGENDLVSDIKITVKDKYDPANIHDFGPAPESPPEWVVWAHHPRLNTAVPEIATQERMQNPQGGDIIYQLLEDGALGKNPEEVLIQQELPDTVREQLKEMIAAAGFRDEEEGLMALQLYDETGFLDPFNLTRDQLDNMFYDQQHWPGFPDVIAHMRTNERVIDGTDLLFLEEGQSDWSSYGEREEWEVSPVAHLQEHNRLMRNLNRDEFNPQEHRYLGDNWQEAVNSWIGMNNRASAFGLLYENGITLDYENLDFSEPRPEVDSLLPIYFLQNGAPLTAETLDDLPHDVMDALGRITELIDTQKQRSHSNEFLGPVDTHGLGRKHFKKNWPELVARTLVLRAAEKGKDGVGWTSGHLQTGRNSNVQYAKGFTDLYDRQIMKEIAKLGKKWGVKPELVDYGETNYPGFSISFSDTVGGEPVPPIFATKEEADNWLLDNVSSMGDGARFEATLDYDERQEEEGVITFHGVDQDLEPIQYFISRKNRWEPTKVWKMRLPPEMIEHLKKFGINVAMEDKKKQLRFDEPLLGTQSMGLLA